MNGNTLFMILFFTIFFCIICSSYPSYTGTAILSATATIIVAIADAIKQCEKYFSSQNRQQLKKWKHSNDN